MKRKDVTLVAEGTFISGPSAYTDAKRIVNIRATRPEKGAVGLWHIEVLSDKIAPYQIRELVEEMESLDNETREKVIRQ